jgi:catechol 2,3-dioxygenase-like lactoylglutathione lyase family enzyme
VSLPFYEEVLGFKRVHEYHFDTFSLYFMYSPKPGEQVHLNTHSNG